MSSPEQSRQWLRDEAEPHCPLHHIPLRITKDIADLAGEDGLGEPWGWSLRVTVTCVRCGKPVVCAWQLHDRLPEGATYSTEKVLRVAALDMFECYVANDWRDYERNSARFTPRKVIG